MVSLFTLALLEVGLQSKTGRPVRRSSILRLIVAVSIGRACHRGKLRVRGHSGRYSYFLCAFPTSASERVFLRRRLVSSSTNHQTGFTFLLNLEAARVGRLWSTHLSPAFIMSPFQMAPLFWDSRTEANWDIRRWVKPRTARQPLIDRGSSPLDSAEIMTQSPPDLALPVKSQSVPHINTLPLELFQKIVRLLIDERQTSAASFLSVCKFWHDAAKPVFWTTLYLDSDDLTCFALKLWHGGTSFHQLRSLYIRMQNLFAPRCNQNAHEDGHWRRHYDERECAGLSHAHVHCDEHLTRSWARDKRRLLQDLCALKQTLIDHLRQLRTFSLVIDNEPDDGDWCLCHTSSIPSASFVDVIDALPATCKYIELDTKGADSADSSGSSHICSALRRILPRLKGLRLRLRSLCPTFFRSCKTSQFLSASPAHKWMSSHRKIALLSQLLDVDVGCYGPGDDFVEWKRWLKVPEAQRLVGLISRLASKLTLILQVWETEYENDMQISAETHEACPYLETCIINLCLFPHISHTSLHTPLSESGVLAAATVAANMRREMSMPGMFPSLNKCLLISADFIPKDENDAEWDDSWRAHSGLSYGPITEIIVHDVLDATTTIMPFRSMYCLNGPQLSRMRDEATHEWRNAEDEVFTATLSMAEPLIEGSWNNDPRTQELACAEIEKKNSELDRPAAAYQYPQYHTQIYADLLDRTGIKEKRIENGTAETYYNNL